MCRVHFHPLFPTVPITTGNGTQYHFLRPVHLPLLVFLGDLGLVGIQEYLARAPSPTFQDPGADSLSPQIGSIFCITKGAPKTQL
jgi:hypothetical protein